MPDSHLLQKYNIPVPRYTSYPTVPVWNERIDVNEFSIVFAHQFTIENSANGISLYIHLPFCETLCTYCGCNKKITTNHSVEDEYIDAVIKEWLEILNKHIRFEERVLFPLIEKNVTVESLQLAAGALSSVPYQKIEWEDKFWIVKK
jgi:hypothetical protein